MKENGKIPEGHGEQYTTKRDAAIIALLTSPSQGEAAKRAGISEATIYRWLQFDDFQQALKEARRQALNLALARLQQSATAAVQVLHNVAENEEAPANARVAAAKTVLELALRAVAMDDIIDRLKKLEELVGRNARGVIQ